MGIVPLLFAVREGVFGLLIDERLPLLVPCSECGGELTFRCLGEGEHECSELFAGLGLGVLGEVLCHLLDLVELADLHWYVLKYPEKPSSPVHHGSKELPALLLENLSAVSIVCHELARNLMPPNVLCKWPCSKDTDTIVPAPKGGVSNDDGWLRCSVWNEYRERIKLFAYPHMRVVIGLCELRESLLAFHVCSSNLFSKTSIPSG